MCVFTHVHSTPADRLGLGWDGSDQGSNHNHCKSYVGKKGRDGHRCEPSATDRASLTKERI